MPSRPAWLPQYLDSPTVPVTTLYCDGQFTSLLLSPDMEQDICLVFVISPVPSKVAGTLKSSYLLNESTNGLINECMNGWLLDYYL